MFCENRIRTYFIFFIGIGMLIPFIGCVTFNEKDMTPTTFNSSQNHLFSLKINVDNRLKNISRGPQKIPTEMFRTVLTSSINQAKIFSSVVENNADYLLEIILFDLTMIPTLKGGISEEYTLYSKWRLIDVENSGKEFEDIIISSWIPSTWDGPGRLTSGPQGAARESIVKGLSLISSLKLTREGGTPFNQLVPTICHEAASGSYISVKAILSRFPEQINNEYKDGYTALHFASSLERLTEKLAGNLPISIEYKDHQTTYHFDSSNIKILPIKYDQYDRTVQTLIDFGADINAKTKKEKLTPLMMACNSDLNSPEYTFYVNDKSTNWKGPYNMQRKIIETLIHGGANVDEISSNGETAIQIAAKKGFNDLAEYLKAKRKDMESD